MKLIETKTLGTAAASIEFTSIPQTFTDLVLLASIRNDGTNVAALTYFNTDTTASNYTALRLNGTGSVTGNGSFANAFFIYSAISSATANTFSNASLYISNYTSNLAKSVSSDAVTENNATLAEQFLTAGLWSGTAAINRILVQSAVSPNFVAGSTFSLYGITKGSDGIVTVS
jgi:hypothetical protein